MWARCSGGSRNSGSTRRRSSCSRRTTDRTTSRTTTCSGSTPPATCAASSGISTTAASACPSWRGGRGTIQPGQVSDHIGYFGDLMATVADLLDVDRPPGTDSISFAPTLRGRAGEQRTHDYLYWEFYEAGSPQAVRMGQWKGVRRPMLTGRLELYDVLRDEGRTVRRGPQLPGGGRGDRGDHGRSPCASSELEAARQIAGC